MGNKLKAHLAILAANIIYGVNYIAVGTANLGTNSWKSIALFRAAGALILLWIASAFIKSPKIKKKDIWKFIIAGLTGVTICQSLLIVGIQNSSPINASVIMMLNPLFVMILAAIMLRFPITKIKALGTIVGSSGAIFLILSSANSAYSSNVLFGDLITLTNAVIYGFYLVWTKPLIRKYGAITVMKYTFLFGCIPVIGFGLKPTMEINYSEISIMAYAALTFIVIGATFLTYLLNVVGLRYINPTTVSAYVYLQPIIASVIAVFIGEDTFSWHKLVSILLVFVGVYLVSIVPNKD